jgi:dolichol-phosphate mannosyltransferase
MAAAPHPAAHPHPGDHAPPHLAVVVPVRNEEENVLPLIGEIRAALDGRAPYEIVYVDDGSTDGTLERLREALVEMGNLKVLRHRTSCGQSAAIATAVKAATAPVIATLDGDGQNDPADIPRLLAVFEAAHDRDDLLVAGLRARRRDTWVKRLSSRIANGVRSRLLKDDTPDTGCGLKVFARAAFLDLPRFDHMHRFLPALFLRRGGRVTSVPVNHRPRERGRSNYGTLDRLWVGVADLLGVLWLMRRGRRPEVEAVMETDR